MSQGSPSPPPPQAVTFPGRPADTARPGTSTLNLAAGDTRPNASVVKLGATGGVSYFSQRGSHLLADVTGYFTGPAPTTADTIGWPRS